MTQREGGPRERPGDQIDRIIRMHQAVFLQLRDSIAPEWMRTDITMPQLKVLLLLHLDGTARMTDLASALDVSMPSATGILDRLVQRGLVVRGADPADRRVVTCALSEDGARQVAALWEASWGLERQILSRLSPRELHVVEEAAEIVLDAAGGVEGPEGAERSSNADAV